MSLQCGAVGYFFNDPIGLNILGFDAMFWYIRRLLIMINEITLYEFNSLSKMEKAEALCEYAVYLLERPDPLFRIALYQVHNFYVEVKYDIFKNAIAEFQLFTNTKLLEPYLSQIDISSLTH